jgi:[ribosomal protein S5]-alanine N-acetyltransferase
MCRSRARVVRQTDSDGFALTPAMLAPVLQNATSSRIAPIAGAKKVMTLASGTDAIQSERLLLRRITPLDLPYFIDIHQDPDVARYIGAGNPRPREETERWLDDILESYARANLGQLAVIRKADGAILGRCGLSDAAIEVTPANGATRKGWFFSTQVPSGVAIELLPELGYTFGKDTWGHGYASEAAGCVYDYALTSLNIPKIMSVIFTDNLASLGVARKFSVELIDEVEMAGRRFDRYLWPMTRALK